MAQSVLWLGVICIGLSVKEYMVLVLLMVQTCIDWLILYV